MGLFEKINLLHLFMFILFIIGLILLIITFYAYSKLDDKCTSSDLRNKLTWAIVIGTIFVTTAIGFMICVRNELCNCKFGTRSSKKIYLMLFILMFLGGFLLWLTFGIQSDLKKDDCNVDLGVVPTILIVLSFAQIIIPALYIGWILFDKIKDKEEGGESDESIALEAKSQRFEINKRRVNRINKIISKKEAELETVQDRIEERKFKNIKAKPGDVTKQTRLVEEITTLKNNLQSINSSNKQSINSSNKQSIDSSNKSSERRQVKADMSEYATSDYFYGFKPTKSESDTESEIEK